VDLSGQHQHQGLVDPQRHREILDAFAAQEAPGKNAGEGSAPAMATALSHMRATWTRLRSVTAAIAELGTDERTRQERADYLRFQLDELDAARLEPGEDERLEAERARLQSVDALQTGAHNAEAPTHLENTHGPG
jgi:DNA repair protein RecN (Recombination protein N)